ncbi:hypothetical protein PINS_up009631 [Pythium insidiosum]|nr:hypothetical protein PINS_up009631 [Pythium insidiosum]
MRNSVVGHTVGYRIGQNQNAKEGTTRITYVTTGYMLERLIHQRDTLSDVTHLLIDEVHERSMDVDALLLLLKLHLREHSHVRVVIMSATMDARVLIKYFSACLSTKLTRRQPLFVGSKLFPVDNLYLGDLVQVFPQLMRRHQNDVQRAGDWFRRVEQSNAGANSEAGLGIISNVHDCQLRIIPTLIQLLIDEHHTPKKNGSLSANDEYIPRQCILVFLPGINSITRLYEELMTTYSRTRDGVSVTVTVLHSLLELEEQQLSFATLSAARATKIVLATNIAESSITLPDVTHVINCGLEKQICLPDSGNTSVEGAQGSVVLTRVGAPACWSRRSRDAWRRRASLQRDVYDGVHGRVHDARNSPQAARPHRPAVEGSYARVWHAK